MIYHFWTIIDIPRNEKVDQEVLKAHTRHTQTQRTKLIIILIYYNENSTLTGIILIPNLIG